MTLCEHQRRRRYPLPATSPGEVCPECGHVATHGAELRGMTEDQVEGVRAMAELVAVVVQLRDGEITKDQARRRWKEITTLQGWR